MKISRFFVVTCASLGLAGAALPPLPSNPPALQPAFAAVNKNLAGENAAAFSPVGYGGAVQQTALASLVEPATTVSLFLGWYALNVYYNIVNKRVLNVLPFPMTISTFQLLTGSVYYLFTVLLFRGKPELPCPVHEPAKQVYAAAAGHAIGQTATVVSLGAGAVSFTHIVKSLEPFFSCIVTYFSTKKIMDFRVYLSLIPVVGGVGLACLDKLSYNHLAFFAAMLSNLAFAIRAVKSKQALTNTKLDAPNLFGIVTTIAAAMCIPVFLAFEGVACFKGIDSLNLLYKVLLSGLFHYLNNEVMYLTLNRVTPVTLAVGNTVKRVFIIAASVIVLGNQVGTKSIVGSAVAISGVLLYSFAKMKFE